MATRRALLSAAASVLAAIVGQAGANAPPPGVPEAVVKTWQLYVEVTGGTFAKHAALVMPDRVVAHAHGVRLSGKPGDEFTVYLTGYSIQVKGVGMVGNVIYLDRIPTIRARYRCMDRDYDYIMWDVLDPIPEDMQVPGISADRRGILYVVSHARPQFHKAYPVFGMTGRLEGRGAELPYIELWGPHEALPGMSGSMVVNEQGKVTGLVVGSRLDNRRLAVISPAEAWTCRFGTVR